MQQNLSLVRGLGLVAATSINIANMIGTGVFLLPVNLASVGGISIFGWVVATAGAAALGLVFAKLGELEPKEGGPYAYARDLLGPVDRYRATTNVDTDYPRIAWRVRG